MRRTRRGFLGLRLSTPVALAGAACLGASGDGVNVTVNGGSPAPSEEPAPNLKADSAPGVVDFTPTPPPSSLDPDDLRGFTMPIAGACFPSNDALMPNAAREFRNGVSEGV